MSWVLRAVVLIVYQYFLDIKIIDTWLMIEQLDSIADDSGESFPWFLWPYISEEIVLLKNFEVDDEATLLTGLNAEKCGTDDSRDEIPPNSTALSSLWFWQLSFLLNKGRRIRNLFDDISHIHLYDIW